MAGSDSTDHTLQLRRRQPAAGHHPGQRPRSFTAYTYDAAGNRKTYSDGTTTVTYTYDAADRVIQATQGAARSPPGLYDAVGNINDLPGVQHRRHGGPDPELHLLREQPHPELDDQGRSRRGGRRRLQHQHHQHARQVGPAGQGSADRHQEREQDHRVPACLHGRRPRDHGHRGRRYERDLGQLVVDLRRQRPPDPHRSRPERQPGVGRVQALHLQQRRPDPAPLPRRRRSRHGADHDHAVPVCARQPGRRDRQRHHRRRRHGARPRELRPDRADRREVPDGVGDRIPGQGRRHACARSPSRSTAIRACGS